MKLAQQWQTLVVPKMDNILKIYVKDLIVEPAPDYSSEGPAYLQLVFDEDDIEGQRYLYFSDPEKKEYFEEKVSDIIKKRVKFTIVIRKLKKGEVDKTSLAINKINFNVKVVESEDDRNG